MEHEDLIDNLDDKCGMKITNFLQSIQSESKPSNTGERPNPYWCPQFGNNLLKIAKHFPLWTAVMSASITSSACSEEYFKELKQFVFKDTKCIRVDKFFVTHIKSLAGAVKILQASNLYATPNKLDDFDDNIDLNKSNVRFYVSHQIIMTLP